MCGGLDHPLQSMCTSWPHSCPCIVTVLCLPPGAKTRLSVPGKCCPLYGSLLQTHLVLSHSTLLSTILGWLCYYRCLRHTQQPPYLLGCYNLLHLQDLSQVANHPFHGVLNCLTDCKLFTTLFLLTIKGVLGLPPPSTFISVAVNYLVPTFQPLAEATVAL